MSLHITGEPAADDLLASDPLALVIGMLLDQRVPMEQAFAGPWKIQQRAGTLDPQALADYDPVELVEVFRQTPAVHRYPSSMAGRVQTLCRVILDEWDGDAAAIWTRDDPDGPTVLQRLRALPGYGEQKAKIFLALLGKQFGFEGGQWREASAPYGQPGSYLSAADITGPAALAQVREHKKAMKAAAKGA